MHTQKNVAGRHAHCSASTQSSWPNATATFSPSPSTSPPSSRSWFFDFLLLLLPRPVPFPSFCLPSLLIPSPSTSPPFSRNWFWHFCLSLSFSLALPPLPVHDDATSATLQHAFPRGARRQPTDRNPQENRMQARTSIICPRPRKH